MWVTKLLISPVKNRIFCPKTTKLTKNASFGPNLVVFGQKILFFTGEIKSFVTYITENPPRHFVHIGFWSGIGQNVQKWQYLAQNDQKCRFGPILVIFGPKILIFMGVSKSFGTNITENHFGNLSALFFGQAFRSNGPKMPIFGPKCQFWANFGRFSAKNPIFWGQAVKLLVPSYRESNF